MHARSANAWAVGNVPVRLAKCLGGWLNVWRVGKVPGWSANACAVGKVHVRSAKMPSELAMCMCGRQMPAPVGKNACAVGKVHAQSANAWAVGKCLRGRQSACAGRLNAWTVGKCLCGRQMPGLVGKVSGESANACAVGNVHVQSAKCLGG